MIKDVSKCHRHTDETTLQTLSRRICCRSMAHWVVRVKTHMWGFLVCALDLLYKCGGTITVVIRVVGLPPSLGSQRITTYLFVLHQ